MSSAAAIQLVVRREISSRVRERAFRTSTLVILLVIGLVIALPKLVGLTSFTVAVVGEPSRQVVEQAKKQADLGGITLTIEELPDDAAARAAADEGDVAAALTSDGTIVTRQQLPDLLEPFLLAAVQDAALQERLRAAKVDPQVLAVPPPEVVSLRGSTGNDEQRKALAFGGMLLLFGQLFGFGTQVAFGVVEEKSSRVVEVVLSAIRPRQLLIGKIVGIGLVGLLQLVIVGGFAGAVGVATGAFELTGETLAVGAQIGLWFLLGFGLFGSLFAAVGATVSRSEDLQQALGPLSTLNFAVFFAGFYASQNPASTLTTVLSYLPPFSPLVMTPRWADGEVAAWQVLVSMALMVLATVLVARLAARIYEGSVLHLGARLPLRAALTRARS